MQEPPAVSYTHLITDAANPASEPLPGYKEVSPMVYCGIYPADGAHYEDVRDLSLIHIWPHPDGRGRPYESIGKRQRFLRGKSER